MTIKFPAKRAVDHLMEILPVEGLSGDETRVAALVRSKLSAAGCKVTWMKHDQAHKTIGKNFSIGNLIVKIPGKRGSARRLFMSHLDTVPLCRGAIPVRRGQRIVSRGKTALGGDNRTAVAAMVSCIEVLLRSGAPRPPITLLFTVGEEVGLLGARNVRIPDLGNPTLGFNIDSGDPRRVIVGAVGADRWEVDVTGRSSHAGVHPEDGVSAILIASRAIEDVSREGYFGRIKKGRHLGTSNVGVIRGGEATNQVADHVYIKGESRSHSRTFVSKITKVYRSAFEKAARGVSSSAGERGKISFRVERDYDAFRMKSNAAPILASKAAATQLGWDIETFIADGGLDANYLNAKGVPTVTLGAGQHGAHTVDEYIDIPEYLDGCRLILELMKDCD